MIYLIDFTLYACKTTDKENIPWVKEVFKNIIVGQILEYNSIKAQEITR